MKNYIKYIINYIASRISIGKYIGSRGSLGKYIGFRGLIEKYHRKISNYIVYTIFGKYYFRISNNIAFSRFGFYNDLCYRVVRNEKGVIRARGLYNTDTRWTYSTKNSKGGYIMLILSILDSLRK